MEEPEKKESLPCREEVAVLDERIVKQVRWLSEQKWGSKRIAKELNLARNTVRRYLRDLHLPQPQQRPTRRRLTPDQQQHMLGLFEGSAKGNATLVAQLLHEQGISISPRSVMRAVYALRQRQYAQEKATIRFESQPGQQMQIDFGETPVRINGQMVKVHFLSAVLCFSRRIFVKAFLSECSDDWREGIAEAFRYFGGVPMELLGDNSRCLVLRHDPSTSTLIFKPSYLQFCRDWNVTPKATRPYRARTKGKTESAVKFIKGNAIAAIDFASFAELEARLANWMQQSDQRIHGTTHQKPAERFEQERSLLRPLPNPLLRVRVEMIRRRVGNDAFVNLNTVRYSVPSQYVGSWVSIQVDETSVVVYHHQTCIATHPICKEPHELVIQAEHHQALYTKKVAMIPIEESPCIHPSPLEKMGRSLKEIEQFVQGEAP